MKNLRVLTLLCVVLTASPLLGQTIKVNWSQTAPFTSYKTYVWKISALRCGDSGNRSVPHEKDEPSPVQVLHGCFPFKGGADAWALDVARSKKVPIKRPAAMVSGEC